MDSEDAFQYLDLAEWGNVVPFLVEAFENTWLACAVTWAGSYVRDNFDKPFQCPWNGSSTMAVVVTQAS